MIVSMQGNWTITVKAKFADYPQRFIVTGAASGNGIYNATTGMPGVPVTGNQWSLAIQNDDGSGFQLSDTRIKFPVLQSGNYVFDIESNDAGGDQDFNDLALTCTTPAGITDFIIYGNVTAYSGCIFNPCFKRWLVIDTYVNLQRALENPRIREVIETLYPERIPFKIDPNPPDPLQFTPIMINLLDDVQLPQKLGNVYTRKAPAAPAPVTRNEKETKAAKDPKAAASATAVIDDDRALLSELSFSSTTALAGAVSAAKYTYDRGALASIHDSLRFLCYTEPAANVTLNFEEYDRTTAELTGGAYTGTGNRSALGSAITDMNGNYIFRFRQSLGELFNEVFNDVASGENVFVQALPDMILKINQLAPSFTTLFESAPYFNIPRLKRIDLCLPKSKLPASSYCFNGNLIGALGNVLIGGNQNTGASTSSAALDRESYGNHLHPTGKISVTNSQAGFTAECACWSGMVDVFGCMYNIRRKKGDPIIRHYTIRFRRQGTAGWSFVNEAYRHPKFSKRGLPNYQGDLVGSFPTSLHVDGGAAQTVPAYLNIQADVHESGADHDWEAPHLDRMIQLHTDLYDWDSVTSSRQPGTFYFRVDGYDAAGNPIAGATDLVALYIDNLPLAFSLDAVAFPPAILKGDCNLYKMHAAELNTPLSITFKANDVWGFLDQYQLGITKCGGAFAVTESQAGISAGSYPVNGEGTGCPGYRGTLEMSKFGDVNAHAITYTPAPVEGGWLKPAEDYSLFNVSLVAWKRETNGYNTGLSGQYHNNALFAIQRI